MLKSNAPRPSPRPLIAGNWKMHGLRHPAAAEIKKLAKFLVKAGRGGPEVLICPPAQLLAGLAGLLKTIGGARRIALGGQDCHVKAQGPHTGDISAEMLKDAGASHVIVGHSERRADHGEGSALVREKALAAHRAGLRAIICIGESLSERQSGRAIDVILRQLDESLPAGVTPENTVVAYEPIWAIGTGRTPNEAEIVEVHARLRQRLVAAVPGGAMVRLLYGGSVKPENAVAIMGLANVDGALVGGASLKAVEFWSIVRAKMIVRSSL
jgi:triosephosphate isomerase